MTWDPAWDAAAVALAAEVLAEPVPQLVSAGYIAGQHAYRFADDHRRYSDMRDPERTRLFAIDARRRFRVGDLVRERGLPREVGELAMELLPYGSTVHRWDWSTEMAVRAGKTTEARLEAELRLLRHRFLGVSA